MIITILATALLVLILHCPAGAAFRDEKVKQYLESGDGFIKDGRYTDAFREYESASKLNPEDPECHYKMGVAQFFLNNFDEAIKHYKEAIRLRGDHFKALNNLALIYEKQDENVEATMLYEKAIKANPSYRLARYNLGVVLYKRDRMDKAGAVAKEMIELFPDYDKGYYLLGLVRENEDAWDDAEKHYLKALSFNSSNQEASLGIKRIRAYFQMTRAQKDELEKARSIISFRLPPDYALVGVRELKTGSRVIHIRYRGEEEIYLVKFPDVHVLDGQTLKTLTGSPQKEFDSFLMEMNISQLNLVKMGVFESDDADGPKPLKNGQYARITCNTDGTDYSGILSIVSVGEGEGPVLFMALAKDGKFTLSAARKFMLTIGNK